METEVSKKRGRPAGSKNHPCEVVETVPAACPHCGSTEREVIRIVKEMEYGGTSPAGHQRTHIVWRRCQCATCRGYFIEMRHENRAAVPTADR